MSNFPCLGHFLVIHPPGVYAKEVIAQGSSVLLCYDAHIEKIG